MADESARVEESASVKAGSHWDNALVFAVLIVLVVSVGQSLGRGAGNHFGWPGVTAFFGG